MLVKNKKMGCGEIDVEENTNIGCGGIDVEENTNMGYNDLFEICD